MNICLFSEAELNKALVWNDERSIHLNKVLHKKTGDTFSAGIIGGQAGTATITETIPYTNPKTNKTEISYRFDFKPESDGKILFPLKMIIGFPRPIQLKRLLRDIAGLGVCEVHLTGTELGEKSYMQSTLVERGAAYKMLLDGTVQAASTHVPALFLHQDLKECLESIQEKTPKLLQSAQNTKFALDNVRPESSLQNLVSKFCIEPDEIKKSGINFIAAIGSERGWTDAERVLLAEKGFTLCSMGKRVLRTETAATVSASIILSSLGFLD
ncbi:MAG: RsmE family RNA methyltransferase [Spirochaetia bacterium]|nr:RsmE family RNA methyltransferase [Spirochaetia bacterium]